MTISTERYQEIKAAAAAKRTARQGAKTSVSETVQKRPASFKTAEEIIEYALKNESK